MKRPDNTTPIGSKEIADLLGVKHSTVHVWRSNGILPTPDWIVGGRPAWAWETIKAWATATGRMPV